MKRSFLLGIGIFAAVSFLCTGQDVQFKTIDGVPHALNPAKPLKGTITLEVERTRTINPYDQSEVGMRMIRFSRDAAGNVILYDPNGSEGHRFDAAGRYLGLLTKKGQGPGEFNPMQLYYAFFHHPGIWVFGGRKVAHFDDSGAFIKERSLKNRIYSDVDTGRFLSVAVTWDSQKKQTRTLKLVEFDMNGAESAVDLLSAENIGMITGPNGMGVGEDWATPDFFYAADPERQNVYCGLNQEYKIKVKDYAGKDLLIIEKLHENVKIGRKDVEILVPGAAKDQRFNWIFSAFPGHLAAIKEVVALPRGYLGVFRITGVKTMELDVFDREGRYLHAVVLPSEIKLDPVQFFATGFGTIEQDGDYSVYREYRIKNLPEIFSQ